MTGRLVRLSDRLVRLQHRVVGGLVVMILGLILLNVIARPLGRTVYWVDEAAVACMVWSVMIGAAALVRSGGGLRLTLFDGILPGAWVKRLHLFRNGVVLIFSCFLLWCSWIWFDPVLMMKSGFDGTAFIRASYNFVYREPTQTLGFTKAFLWLVMPVTALLMILHGLANFSGKDAG